MRCCKAFGYIAAAALFLGVLASGVAAQGRNPGSVLIYPVHRSGPSFFTLVCVTNTNTRPMSPASFGGSTGVHFQYVNVMPGSNPFIPAGCSVFDRHEFLTPADTLCVLTGCHNATRPGGQEGYLVVAAEDPGLWNVPWSHNHLVGSAIVIAASGAIYSVNAIPFASPVMDGAPTDANGNGRLDFDNVEYSGVPDVLTIDSFIALSGSQLALANLTGSPSDLNTVYLSVWNDNEFPISSTLAFSCWFDQPLSIVSPLFSASFLAGLPNDPGEADITCNGRGDLETGWATIDSLDVTTRGGLLVDTDGAIIGSITSGDATMLGAGRLLWESTALQTNGVAFTP